MVPSIESVYNTESCVQYPFKTIVYVPVVNCSTIYSPLILSVTNVLANSNYT